ncbi:DUF3035 domain-containing protein [Pelagibacteraceae bacterium]|nr:DUF3035 domain-containing protein [Pelagibacteraceae bacterium]
MKINKSIFLLLLITFGFTACSSVEEAGKVLRNEKTRSTDEFLIKKKQPLTQPPDFKSIPAPKSLAKNKDTENKKIEEILRTNNSKKTKSNSSSTEQSIINQIKK